jgi:hypothetical protein
VEGFLTHFESGWFDPRKVRRRRRLLTCTGAYPDLRSLGHLQPSLPGIMTSSSGALAPLEAQAVARAILPRERLAMAWAITLASELAALKERHCFDDEHQLGILLQKDSLAARLHIAPVIALPGLP